MAPPPEVLAGAVLAPHRRRVYDAVVLKVLGARRSNVIGAFAIEFGLVGLSTAIVAAIVAFAIIGKLTDWIIVLISAPFLRWEDRFGAQADAD